MTKGIIDTHLHIWDLEKAEYPWLQEDNSILNQTWAIQQIETAREESGVSGAVLVQASGNPEDTNWMLTVARNTDWVRGVVGWLPLMDTHKTAQLLESFFLQNPYLKGVRHQIHDEPDTKWLLKPEVIASLRLLEGHDISFDIVAVVPEHIEVAIEVAKKVPGLRMVFDHLSQPPIPTHETYGEWGMLMKEAAQHKNFYAKISGLGTASGNFNERTPDDVKPYIEFALDHFGVNRCFCGSDWPVSMLANNYTGTWNMYKEILDVLLSPTDQEKVLNENAIRFYNLEIG